MPSEEPEFPLGVGPHEGRELDLLLEGNKPAASFRMDGLSAEYERRFDSAVARGHILQFDFPAEDPHLHRRYYCVAGEEWRVKLMALLDDLLAQRRMSEFSEDDLHRMHGTLLGYAKADIDAFLRHIRSLRRALSRCDR